MLEKNSSPSAMSIQARRDAAATRLIANGGAYREHDEVERPARPAMVPDRVIPPKDETLASGGERAAALIALGGIAAGLGVAGHELYQAGLFNDMQHRDRQPGLVGQSVYEPQPLPENPSEITVTIPPQANTPQPQP